MKSSRRKNLLAIPVLSLLLIATYATNAFGTPSSTNAVSTLLNQSAFDQRVQINTDSDKLMLKALNGMDVANVQTVAQPGWTSGWHRHAGPAIVAIKSGSLTFYLPDCSSFTVTAGHGYVETPGVPILARNESGGVTEWYTTHLIPHGALTRLDEPDSLCGLN
ncbi:MAG TPA: hypothetical protein VMT88_01165 [Actinomycetes bacterium]|nr:hypothetical protein [Actinomycetes bacterium]